MSKKLVAEEAPFPISYNFETNQGLVVYPETVSPDETSIAYKWFMRWVQEGLVALGDIQGLIFDFRNVTQFDPGNFQKVKQESRRTHEIFAGQVKNIPVALLVGNLYQEQMVKVSSKVTGQEGRVRILYTDEAVQSFFAEWYQQSASEAEEG